MGCISCIFSTKTLLTLLLLSAIPIGILIGLETAPATTQVYQYHSKSYFRECAKWDRLNRRFIVSYMEGGVGVVTIPDPDHDQDQATRKDAVYDEITTVKDADLAGNSSLGIAIDRTRNRLLVVVADAMGSRYSGLAAYDLSSWQRLFLTHLTSPSGEKSFADDIAVDEEGNAYITDVRASKIWKVKADGELLSIIRSPLFVFKGWYRNLLALNGIVYHPDGYLLVIHTASGTLYKIDLNKVDEPVKVVRIVTGSLVFGDGLELLSPSKLVVAGTPGGKLIESSDGWQTASVVGKFRGPGHRLATATTVKDGKVYLSYLVGLGYPKRKHVLVEANFQK